MNLLSQEIHAGALGLYLHYMQATTHLQCTVHFLFQSLGSHKKFVSRWECPFPTIENSSEHPGSCSPYIFTKICLASRVSKVYGSIIMLINILMEMALSKYSLKGAFSSRNLWLQIYPLTHSECSIPTITRQLLYWYY